MNILVLHNNNLPFYLRDPEYSSIGNYYFDARLLKYDSTIHTMDFDSFISTELSFLQNEDYDIIVLPFTFSEENYLEYTGIRVATHIRLTPIWGKLTTPILFLGPDTADDIIQLSNLGQIIHSYHVFQTDQKEQEPLLEIIEKIVTKYPKENEKKYTESQRYINFINSLNILPPANYATHHSIANEWALIRWNQMFLWNGPEPQIKNKSILDLLYFKYIEARAGVREQFTSGWKKKHSIDPIIRGINGKKIVYVDDESCKGWDSLLGKIIKNSQAEFYSFPFSTGQTKNDLIISIENYLANHEADCYLIDLRLHDDDFNSEIESKDFTGVQIAKYIKSKNLGNQIVMFTASNKTWNYEETVNNIGVNSYIIKESPEYNYSRDDSYLNFGKFSSAIRDACNRSYIAKYVDIINGCNFMKDKHRNSLLSFVEMLALDEKRTLKNNILNLAVFIESYILDKFSISGTKLVNKIDETISHCTFNNSCVHFSNDFTSVKFYEKPTQQTATTIILDPNKPASIIIIALRYYYALKEDECNLYLRLRYERNENVAHNGGTTSISINELKTIFEKIILRIIEKDKAAE